MKRIIAVLLAVIILLAGISASAEDNRQEAEDFIRSLEQWAWNLNPEASDYMGTVRWIGGKPIEVLFRNDGKIIEASHSGFGKLQISGDKIMLDIGGKKFGLSLSAFAGIFRKADSSTSSSGEGSFAEDLEMLRPWLMRAFSEVVLPCVSLRPGRDGLMIHLEANNEVLREKITDLVDSFLAERKTAERLLSRYRTYLRLLFPDLPRTFDGLEKAWEAEKQNPAFFGQAFSIVADITYSQSDEDLAVTGKVDLFVGDEETAGLSFELVRGRDAADLILSLSTASEPFRLEYHRSESRLQAAVEVSGFTYSLNVDRSAQGDGKIHYSATFGGRDALNRALAQYDLEADADPGDGSLEATLYHTKKPDSPGSSRKKMATLDVARRVNGWDGTLDLPVGKFLIHVGGGDQYGTLRLEYKGFSILPGWYVEGWLYHPADEEYRLVVDTNLVHHRKQTYTVELRRHEVDYTVSVGSKTVCHINAAYRPQPDGCELEIEYMNPVSKHPVFRTGETPSKLVFTASRNRYLVDLEWRMAGNLALKGEGMLDLGANGVFRELTVDALEYGMKGTGAEKHYRLAVNPLGITVDNNGDVFSLGLTENTAEKLAVALTNGKSKEYGGLVLSLEDGIFSGKLKVFGVEMAGFSIEPVPKEPIQPIREEGALMITPDFLLSLLGVRK